jgi:hypothetical protein
MSALASAALLWRLLCFPPPLFPLVVLAIGLRALFGRR